MEILNYKEHIICYNWYNHQVNKNLSEFLDNKKHEEILNRMKQKTVLVLGWDWAMLRAISMYRNNWYVFFWINFGRKWFLLNDRKYLNTDFDYIQRIYPLIEIKTTINWTHKSDYAMNEIDIRAWVGKMIWLELNMKDNQKIEIEWDWLIISTPAWSTGYNSSLWWPIMPHKLEAFVITPKAPWKPRFQMPIIMNNTEKIVIINTWRKNPLEIYCDGRLFLTSEKDKDISLSIKKSNLGVYIIILKNYLEIWDNKVLHEQGFTI